MMSLEQIRAASQEEAERAAEEERTPYVPWDDKDPGLTPPFPFPMLGYYIPPGWELVDTLFVDSTGLDPDDAGGPALSLNAFAGKLRECMKDCPKGHSVGFALREAGEFQVKVGVYHLNLHVGKSLPDGLADGAGPANGGPFMPV